MYPWIKTHKHKEIPYNLFPNGFLWLDSLRLQNYLFSFIVTYITTYGGTKSPAHGHCSADLSYQRAQRRQAEEGHQGSSTFGDVQTGVSNSLDASSSL